MDISILIHVISLIAIISSIWESGPFYAWDMLLVLKSTGVCFVAGAFVLIVREKLQSVAGVEVICALLRRCGPLWFKYYHLGKWLHFLHLSMDRDEIGGPNLLVDIRKDILLGSYSIVEYIQAGT